MDFHNIISNAQVYGLESSIKRAKYPMSTDTTKLTTDLTDGIKKLAQSGRGEGHDQWLTGVVVQLDLTFTVKCWTEAERYHFLDFISSQSTMHRITKFDLDKAYIEYVTGDGMEVVHHTGNYVCYAIFLADVVGHEFAHKGQEVRPFEPTDLICTTCVGWDSTTATVIARASA